MSLPINTVWDTAQQCQFLWDILYLLSHSSLCYLFSSLVEFGSRGTFTKYWFWKTFSLLKPEKQWVDPVAETIIDFPVHCRFIIIYEKNSEQTRSGLTDSPVFLGEWFEYCGPAGGGSINKLWRSYYHFNTTLALIASLITEKHHMLSTQSVAVRERISPSSEINEWSRLDLMDVIGYFPMIKSILRPPALLADNIMLRTDDLQSQGRKHVMRGWLLRCKKSLSSAVVAG